MILTYECDDCEDIEQWDSSEFVEGMHCECGGHLFLVRRNNYEKGCEITQCLTCKHKDTNPNKCIDCIFNN